MTCINAECRVGGRWDFPKRFQRKALEGRQRVAGSESLQASPERTMCETGRVTLQLLWKLQECRIAGDSNTRQGGCRQQAGSARERPCDLKPDTKSGGVA